MADIHFEDGPWITRCSLGLRSGAEANPDVRRTELGVSMKRRFSGAIL
jgi:hypothetical protein